MPWVRFLQAYDHRPTRRTMIAYRGGQVALVTTACAASAIAASMAVKLPTPNRDERAAIDGRK